ncbi:hypothetical protein [Nubsella zeaxanthinifaciens]|jgi:nitrous oxide reductase accessory protein NosL|nr:hypothetical protein [Nubsella zeaxanthinifaciens]
MKKLTFLILALGLFVAACGTSRTSDATSPDSMRVDTNNVVADTTKMERP